MFPHASSYWIFPAAWDGRKNYFVLQRKTRKVTEIRDLSKVTQKVALHGAQLRAPNSKCLSKFPRAYPFGDEGTTALRWGRQPENFSLDVFPALSGFFHWWISSDSNVASSAQICIMGWHWVNMETCGLLEARRAPHILSTPPDPYLLQMFHDGCQDFPPTIWTMSQMTNWQTIFPEPWYTSALFWWKSARACKVLMVMGACCLLPHIQSSRLEYY